MKKQDQVEENMSVENKISVNRRIEENYTKKMHWVMKKEERNWKPSSVMLAEKQ